MKRFSLSRMLLALPVLLLAACNSEDKKDTPKDEPAAAVKLKEENVNYTADGASMTGFVVYDENKQGKRPAVLVVPEWWGLNDYAKNRARQLAGLGYIAMALDFYGNGKQADNPDSALKYAMPFYQDPQKALARFHAGHALLNGYAQTDSTKVAAIGYCFGGAQVLNVARLGEDLKGVVSFHGNLVGVEPKKELLKADVLVCHGAADSMVPQAEADQFKKQMDAIGASYTFKAYDSAKHAFTNPDATENGKKFNLDIAYNAAADSASWTEMKNFFQKIFR